MAGSHHNNTGTMALALLIFGWYLQNGQSAKILFIPENVQSHMQYYSKLAIALTEEGHKSTILVQSNARIPTTIADNPNITIHRYKVDDVTPFINSHELSEMMVKSALSSSTTEKISLLRELSVKAQTHWQKDCEHLFADTDLFNQMKNENFDFAFPDVSPQCQMVYPYALGIPYYGLISAPFYPWIYRVPGLFSMVPSLMSIYTDRMDFWQRLSNAYTELNVMTSFPTTTKYVQRYAPNREPLTPTQLWQKASIWFLLDDVAFGYPKPSMPNTVNLADIIPSKISTLPDNFQEFMQASHNGVVLISFGSCLQHIPDEVIMKICQAVINIGMLRVIWKLHKPELCDFPHRIYTTEWLPQNDLLAHPNTKVFLTHAGLNSMIESISNGVPMVAMPIAVDQPGNAQRILNKGLGMVVNFANFTSDELQHALLKTLQDSSIHKAIKEASRVLTNKLNVPGKRASFWINHILENGDQHLRTSAYDLSHFEFFMLDIFLFVVMVMLVLVTVVAVGVYCLLKLCCRICKTVPKDKSE